MINCAIVKDLLPMYADKETSAETSAMIKEHLKECPECRERYRQSCHIARSMQQPPCGKRYEYSVLAHRISQRNTMHFVAGCAVAAALGYIAGKLIFSERG